MFAILGLTRKEASHLPVYQGFHPHEFGPTHPKYIVNLATHAGNS